MNAVQLLEETGNALRDALMAKDWTTIGELDQCCRQAVDEAMSDMQDESRLRMRMEELLTLYRELIVLCQTEQKRVESDLIQLNQSKRSAKIYQIFG